MAFGSNGRLKVFNEQQWRYEDGVIVDRNLFTNGIDRQGESIGCNITSLSLINTTNNAVTIINHTGFNILYDTDIYVQVRIKINIIII